MSIYRRPLATSFFVLSFFATTEALSIPTRNPLILTGTCRSSSTSLCMATSEHIPTSPIRRDVFNQVGSILLSTVASTAKPSFAYAKSKEPITPEKVKLAFAAVRDQLAPDGGIQELKSLIDKEDYEAICEFTKTYDLEFRKAKMVKARKFITSNDDKERGLYLSNSVTFDLIGINKASRVGKEDIKEVQKYWDELKVDVENFLELEKGIDFSLYDS